MSSSLKDSHLLTDDQMASFIISGYHIIEPVLTPEYHQAVFDHLRAMPENPGEAIVEALPELAQLLDDPAIDGALTSLLGIGYARDPGGHIHMNPRDAQVFGVRDRERVFVAPAETKTLD